MVIPVCFKCEHPVNIMSASKQGMEVISYQCTACNHTSASFLLGYVEAGNNNANESEPASEPTGRAELFSQAADNYKLRAKMQGLIDLRNDVLAQTRPPDDSSDTG